MNTVHQCLVEHQVQLRAQNVRELAREIDELVAELGFQEAQRQTRLSKTRAPWLTDLILADAFKKAAARREQEEERYQRKTPASVDYGQFESDQRERVNLSDATLTEATESAIRALAAQGRVYQRGGCLVDFTRAAEPDGTGGIDLSGMPQIRRMPLARLREYASQSVQFIRIRTTAMGERYAVRVEPPRDIVETIEARGEWPGIRPLVSVVPHPVLNRDGSVLQTPGYDGRSGLYYAGPADVAVPDRPTEADAKAAVAELLDVVSDFHFASNAARAVYLAALLTLFARPAINGPTPMFSFEANVPGAGKGLLTDTIGEIVLGKPTNKSTAPSSEEEWTKHLSSVGLAGGELVVFDNVKHQLGGQALEAVLTCTEYEARILGQSRISVVPWLAVIFVTWNNGVYSSDLTRRSLVARLESPYERPEERSDIRRPNLLAYCHEHRTRLQRAALTILRAYRVAGRPEVKMRPMGSYEAWSAVVRAPLVWLGLDDPALTQDVLRENSDPEHEALEFLVTTWYATFGLAERTAGEIIAAPAMYQAVADFADVKASDAPSTNKRKLGNALAKAKGRPVAGLRLVKGQKGVEGVRWSLEAVSLPSVPTSDQGGDS